MKILKYILLLILLFFLALTVYLSTAKGVFTVTKSKIISIDKTTVFHYVNDFQNWEFFWKTNDHNRKINYPINTIGVGSSLRWTDSNGDSFVKTIYLKENDSIAQKVNWYGESGEAYITFKDTIGGTKVTWNTSGELDFMGKLKSLVSGGFENKLHLDFENNLTTLEKVLNKEISTYTVDLEGVVEVTHQKYLKRKDESKISEFYSVLQKSLPILHRFVQDNNIKTNNQQFAVFDTYDIEKNKTIFSLGTTLKDIIYTTPESEFTVDSIQPHQALKIMLKGDYSHSKEAWDKGFDYLKKNNLEQDFNGAFREVYVKNKIGVKQPSQWITEIYIPVKKHSIKTINTTSINPVNEE